MADTTSTNTQLLDDLRDEQAGFEALLNDIGEEHMNEPGVAGEWSVKDVVAHLTAWRRRTVSRFQAVQRHEPVPAPPWPENLPTDDDINAWFYATDRGRPLADVLRESRDVFDHLYATLAGFPEAELLDPARFPWIGAEEFPLTGAAFFGHFHEEHEADLRAWLEKVRRDAKG